MRAIIVIIALVLVAQMSTGMAAEHEYLAGKRDLAPSADIYVQTEDGTPVTFMYCLDSSKTQFPRESKLDKTRTSEEFLDVKINRGITNQLAGFIDIYSAGLKQATIMFVANSRDWCYNTVFGTVELQEPNDVHSGKSWQKMVLDDGRVHATTSMFRKGLGVKIETLTDNPNHKAAIYISTTSGWWKNTITKTKTAVRGIEKRKVSRLVNESSRHTGLQSR